MSTTKPIHQDTPFEILKRMLIVFNCPPEALTLLDAIDIVGPNDQAKQMIVGAAAALENWLDLHDQDIPSAAAYPRAFKLMMARENFIVIAEREEYFLEAYQMIRLSQQNADTWSKEDEEIYQRFYDANCVTIFWSKESDVCDTNTREEAEGKCQAKVSGINIGEAISNTNADSIGADWYFVAYKGEEQVA